MVPIAARHRRISLASSMKEVRPRYAIRTAIPLTLYYPTSIYPTHVYIAPYIRLPLSAYAVVFSIWEMLKSTTSPPAISP